MCRQKQLLGFVLMALGAGVLLSLWLGGGFWQGILGLSVVIVGYCLARKK